MAPPSKRGRLVGAQQWAITWGIMIMFYISYGCSFIKGTAAFRLPWGLQAIPGILLFIGVVGKSAQFPLQSWLGDAMAGPTPVSALIHAATMVTAGVYLVVRSGPIYEGAPAATLAVVLPVLAGLAVVAREPPMALSSAIPRFEAAFRSSWVYRI